MYIKILSKNRKANTSASKTHTNSCRLCYGLHGENEISISLKILVYITLKIYLINKSTRSKAEQTQKVPKKRCALIVCCHHLLLVIMDKLAQILIQIRKNIHLFESQINLKTNVYQQNKDYCNRQKCVASDTKREKVCLCYKYFLVYVYYTCTKLLDKVHASIALITNGRFKLQLHIICGPVGLAHYFNLIIIPHVRWYYKWLFITHDI